MKLTLSTRRLCLRPLQATDVSWCVELLSNHEVMRYISGEDTASAEDVIAEMPLAIRRGAGGSIGVWAIELSARRICVGTVFLLPLPIEDHDTDWRLLSGDALPDAEIELGFILHQRFWGQGYATEAASRLVEFAFRGTALDQIVAVIEADNLASARVLLKTGFRNSGLRRAYAGEYPGFVLRRQDWLRGDAR